MLRGRRRRRRLVPAVALLLVLDGRAPEVHGDATCVPTRAAVAADNHSNSTNNTNNTSVVSANTAGTAVLPFCGAAPAGSAWLDNNTNASATALLAAADASAAKAYGQMLRVLDRFDCSKPYSYHSCDQCRAYYKQWVCLMMLPQCDSGDEGDGPRAPCLETCHRVLRACPYNLQFTCPAADSLFEMDYSTNEDSCDAGTVMNASEMLLDNEM